MRAGDEKHTSSAARWVWAPRLLLTGPNHRYMAYNPRPSSSYPSALYNIRGRPGDLEKFCPPPPPPPHTHTHFLVAVSTPGNCRIQPLQRSNEVPADFRSWKEVKFDTVYCIPSLVPSYLFGFPPAKGKKKEPGTH